MHMDFITDTCKSIYSKSGKLFKSFVEQFRPINTDYSDFSLPQMICPTRWIGISDQMRYLLTYGRLYHRFQLAHNEVNMGLMKHLLTLQETAWLVFLLEKAMKGQQLLEGRKRHRMERFGYKETPTKARMKSQSNNHNHRNEEGRKQRN